MSLKDDKKKFADDPKTVKLIENTEKEINRIEKIADPPAKRTRVVRGAGW
jgi:hypothetical protein